MTEPFDVDPLQAWIGREESASQRLDPASVARFNALFDRTGDLSEGALAPPMIHYSLCLPITPQSELGADGHPMRGNFLPPVSLPKRMWASSQLDWYGTFSIGQLIHRTSTIAEITQKNGRAGQLVFVTVEHNYTGDSVPLLREKQNLVYLGTTTARTSEQSPAVPGDHVRQVQPSPPLLFRYSALTGNAHRIHYDERYAREVEGYPGLVVHGPLQATLLALFALDLKGKPPTRMSVRALTPIFDGKALTLNARADGDDMTLWTASTGGPAGMEVRAEWSTSRP